MLAAIDEAVGRLQRTLRDQEKNYDLFYEVMPNGDETTYVIRIVHRKDAAGRYLDSSRTILNSLSRFPDLTTEGAVDRSTIRKSSFAETLASKGVKIGEEFSSTNGYKFRGVYKNGNRYRASLRHHGKRISLGSHPTPEEAAKAYNEGALRYIGPDATLNEV